MREKIIDFFRPNKKKVIFSLILPIIHLYLTIFLVRTMEWLFSSGIPSSLPGRPTLKTFIFYPLSALFWYPFSCSAITIKEKGLKMIKGDKTTSGLVIFGMVVNPFVFQLLFLILIYVFLRIMVLRGF